MDYTHTAHGLSSVITGEEADAKIAYYRGAGAVFVNGITTADNGTVIIEHKNDGRVKLTPRPAADKPLDLDYVEQGTYMESPTGRRYYVSDFGEDARGTYLWLLGEGATRRRRLYQDQVPDGWTAAPTAR